MISSVAGLDEEKKSHLKQVHNEDTTAFVHFNVDMYTSCVWIPSPLSDDLFAAYLARNRQEQNVIELKES